MESARYIIGLVFCAFCMGFVFDVYNTVTGASKWLRWLRPGLDVLFWVLSACFVYYVTFLTSGGKLRLYTVLLLLIGYGLYFVILHRLVEGIAFTVLTVLGAIIRFVVRVLNAIVFRPVLFFMKVVWWLVSRLYDLGVWTEDLFVSLLSLIARIVWMPFRRFLPHNTKWQQFIAKRWEDFWVRLSNLVRYRSQRV